MKRLVNWLKEQWVWFTSKKVRDAINSDATYDEVQAIVREEMQR